MLYQRWLEIARNHPARVAVIDGAAGSTITFEDLSRRAAAMPPARGPVVARTGSPSFLLEILHAWRDGQPAVPLEAGADDPSLAAEVPPGVALIKHTPGACGVARGIFFTADALVAEAARLVAAMEMSGKRPNLAAISLAHSYGFSNLVLPLLLHGIPLHLLPDPFPQTVQSAFASHRALTLPAVPSLWRAWFRSGLLAGAPIATAISAGAPLSLALEQQVHAHTGLKLRNFYGASECGGVSFDASAAPRRDPADVGSQLDGVTVTVHPSGRLLVESDATGFAYDRPLPGDHLSAGRFLTQDIGRRVRGRVFLDSFAGNAINVAGRKVSPAKVEAALLATGIPRRVRVFGLPSNDPDRVQTIVAMVELSPHSSLDPLKAAAAAALPPWELPRRWWPNPPPNAWTQQLPNPP